MGGATKNNVYLNNNANITVSGNLSSTAKIGVTIKNPRVFTNGLSGKGSIRNFTSDNTNYSVVLSNNEAALEAHTHDFTYVKSGDNTIIATCSADGCGLTDSKATLTITPPTSGGGAAVLSGDTDAFTISGDITYSQKTGVQKQQLSQVEAAFLGQV